MLAGLVVSRGFGFAAGGEVLLEKDSRDARATEEAVGAARDVRLALRVMSRAGACFGDREDLLAVGDLTISGDFGPAALLAVLGGSTAMALGLTLGLRLLVDGTETDFCEPSLLVVTG